jgi:hypothetical protein
LTLFNLRLTNQRRVSLLEPPLVEPEPELPLLVAPVEPDDDPLVVPEPVELGDVELGDEDDGSVEELGVVVSELLRVERLHPDVPKQSTNAMKAVRPASESLFLFIEFFPPGNLWLSVSQTEFGGRAFRRGNGEPVPWGMLRFKLGTILDREVDKAAILHRQRPRAGRRNGT